MVQMDEGRLGHEDYLEYEKVSQLWPIVTRSIDVPEYARDFNPKTDDEGYVETDVLQNRLENTDLRLAKADLKSIVKRQFNNESRIVTLEKQLVIYESVYGTTKADSNIAGVRAVVR